jgi:hypothetical protein
MTARWAALLTFALGTAAVVQSQHAPAAPLFSSDSVLHVRLEAPLQTLFSAAQKNPDHEVTGTLTYTDDASGRPVVLSNVAFAVRGHTSMQPSECSFPKLKAKFAGGDAVGATIFRGMKSVKIGTHCGDRPDSPLTPKGRLANDKAPPREALVYRLLDALGVASLKARPAEITYVDGAQTVKRQAMFVEDMSTAIVRLGADREIDKMHFTTAREMFAPAEAAKLAFGEALIGNFDWCVKWTADDTYRCDARQILWNVSALGRANGRAIPLMYDFDVTGMVAGRHGWFPRVFDEGFAPSRSRPEIEVVSQVQRTRSLFARAQLDATRASFVDRKAAAYNVLERAEVDPQGKATIKAYMDAFFGAIEADEAFYRPVVTRPSVTAFADAAHTRPVCAVTVPPGTLVAEADGGATADDQGHTAGAMAHVRVLDVLWGWAMNRRCDALRSEAVWIDQSAISVKYPQQ